MLESISMTEGLMKLLPVSSVLSMLPKHSYDGGQPHMMHARIADRAISGTFVVTIVGYATSIAW